MLIKCIASAIFSCSPKSFHIAPSLAISTKIGVRYAGHSKWQNIKHTKLAKDLEKNRLYNRHIDEIKLAVREGKSVSVKANIKLARAIEVAKKEGVALATINGVLQKLEKSMLNPKPSIYEFRGPNGVLIVITANTDNKNRTRGEINAFAKKYGLAKAENLRSAFDHKGFIYVKSPSEIPNPDEKALEDAIEVGAEEVQRDEENPELLVFSCEATDCNVIKSKLEGRNYNIEEYEEVYISRSSVELDEEEAKKLYEVFQKIDEIPEVNGIYSNLA